ncbi:hypothetical protein [uncultured Lactobacillus sp.]|uniref:hypothetical protein n=1 Tax=uncultured Lactobacillus sp. TaxID=153152 RepID=UPI002631E75C|nr:hypothetical protein [uncultured Lactobacillus sp.]
MIKKISFWVRLAGWSGLISGSSVLVLYQYTHNIMFLINLITIILFSAYALATSNDKRWKNTDWLLRVILIVLVFVSILPTIFLGVGYFIERKRNQH